MLCETKTAEFSLPCSVRFAHAPKILVEGARSNFEGKSRYVHRGGAESSPFVHIFLALRLDNILLHIASLPFMRVYACVCVCVALAIILFRFPPGPRLPFCAPTGAAVARNCARSRAF